MTDFKPMLAKDGDPSKLTYPVLAQPKYDGIRASVVNGKLVSRSLKPIPNASIRAVLEDPAFEGLDGELIVGDPTASDCYRQTASFVMAPNKTGGSWAFYVFDKWDEDGGSVERINAADDVVERSTWTDYPLFMVPTVQIDHEQALEAYEADALANGHEGVIVRVPDAPYKFGRSGKTGPLLKVKRFIDFEATVIGVYEELHNGNVGVTNELGRTSRSSAQAGKTGKGRLGGLIVRAINGPHAGQQFRCGTGFDAKMRREMWETYDDLIGTLVKIKSFPIGAKDKPRHPVYVGVRSTIDL